MAPRPGHHGVPTCLKATSGDTSAVKVPRYPCWPGTLVLWGVQGGGGMGALESAVRKIILTSSRNLGLGCLKR